MNIVAHEVKDLRDNKATIDTLKVYRMSPEIFLAGLRAVDLILLLLAAAAVSFKSVERLNGLQLQHAATLAVLTTAGLTYITLHAGGAYRSVTLSWWAQARCAVFALTVSAIGLWGLLEFIAQDPPRERVIWQIWLSVTTVTLIVSRFITVPLTMKLQTRRRLMRRVALYKPGKSEYSFVRRLRADALDNVDLVGIYDEGCTSIGLQQHNLPLLGGLHEMVADLRSGLLDAVVVGIPVNPEHTSIEVFKRIEGCAVDVVRVYDPISSVELPIDYLGGLPVTVLSRRPLSVWQTLKKAAFDKMLAVVLLVILSPIFLVISALIRLDSEGPILFRQPRVGFNNNLFICLKFRTMRNEMRDLLGGNQVTPNDPRVTRVGNWLRRLSLDELPQLLNVLWGEMSLVGPRPHPPNVNVEGRLFAELLPGYAGRHRIMPGITGWAQVNGWRGAATTAFHLEQRVRYDVYYIENWSLSFDLYILFLTLLRGFTGPQAF